MILFYLGKNHQLLDEDTVYDLTTNAVSKSETIDLEKKEGIPSDRQKCSINVLLSAEPKTAVLSALVEHYKVSHDQIIDLNEKISDLEIGFE